jgi:hypothetical protein
MCISEEHFRRLFSRLRVHPNFLDIVQLFSQKVGPVEEGFSSFFAETFPQGIQGGNMMASKDCSYRTVFVSSSVDLTNWMR